MTTAHTPQENIQTTEGDLPFAEEGNDTNNEGEGGPSKRHKSKGDPGTENTLSLYSGSHLASCETVTCPEFSQARCRKALARFIITDGMPFHIVEREGFQELIRTFEPRFQMPSRVEVMRDCWKLYLEEARNNERYFKETKVRVSLTINTWTSNQDSNYICLTAHWIDEDWTYQKRILNFYVVKNHEGDTIADEIEKCLLSWGINKVFTITVDDAPSNNTTVASLKRVLKHWNGLVCDGDYLHLRCCGHILNLVVSDGVKDMHKCIEGIRNAIVYVRSSLARFSKFKELVEKMKIDSTSLLCIDCPTRWDSTYMMLENAIKFSNVFERMEQEDKDYVNNFLENKLIGPPDALDWKYAKDFVIFLKVLYNITLQFSGSLHVTSNICFQHIVDVSDILQAMANNHNSLLCNMAKGMQSKYDKYWGKFENLNPLLVIAVVLDPRYKMKYLNFIFEDKFHDAAKCEAMSKKVLDVLYCLYDHYSSELDTSQTQNQSQTQVESESSSLTQTLVSVNEALTLLGSTSSMQRFLAQIETKIQTDKYAEVEKYLQAELAEAHDPKFDILTWWKVNATKYKVLSLIAHDVLAMPVSTVFSESAFSTRGFVIDESRGSLFSKMAEALICAQNWLSPSTLKPKELDIDNFYESDNAVQEVLAASYISDEEGDEDEDEDGEEEEDEESDNW
ncbi:hypothetical protein QN277_001781 [Acacia crassicarpa]|uniref:Transposase n=1 Tax=Acacia crassicarpa TaxID=499986 RepID=A0AAE1N7U6_9FABA|nr:hypothetical protein QN277_001781 [Acacia crassicarpa]